MVSDYIQAENSATIYCRLDIITMSSKLSELHTAGQQAAVPGTVGPLCQCQLLALLCLWPMSSTLLHSTVLIWSSFLPPLLLVVLLGARSRGSAI